MERGLAARSASFLLHRHYLNCLSPGKIEVVGQTQCHVPLFFWLIDECFPYTAIHPDNARNKDSYIFVASWREIFKWRDKPKQTCRKINPKINGFSITSLILETSAKGTPNTSAAVRIVYLTMQPNALIKPSSLDKVRHNT